MTRGLRVDSWMKLGTGDIVREIDGRHEGRVEAIEHGAWVIVQWLDTGWKSLPGELRLCDVERVESYAMREWRGKLR